jgi:hypothetical protein
MTVDTAIADRLAIRELVERYAFAVDARDWELYRGLFTPGATIDYTDSGGPAGDAESMAAWLAEALAPFAGLQHNMTSHLAEVDGDTARSCTYFIAIHTILDGAHEQILALGGFYRDTLRRTPSGWRIAERVELGVWMQGPYPDDVAKPPWYGSATRHLPTLSG